MSDKNLMDVIEDLLNESIADNINKITADNQKKKPEHGHSADTQGVLGSTTGSAMNAGGDKDVGGMEKGKFASDASPDAQGIMGKTSGAALDAGGDKDVGVRKSHDQVIPSAASSKVEADKGPHNQAKDPGLKEYRYYDEETGEELSEEEVAELEAEGLVEFVEEEEFEDELEEWILVDEETGEELSEEDIDYLYAQMVEEGLIEEDELEEDRDMQAARSKGGSKKGSRTAQMKDALTRYANDPNKRSDVTLAGPGGKPIPFVRKSEYGGQYAAKFGSIRDYPIKLGRTTKDAAYKKASDQSDASDMKKAIKKIKVKDNPNTGGDPNRVKMSKSGYEPSSGYSPKAGSRPSAMDAPVSKNASKDQGSAAAGSTVKAKKIKPGMADRYGSIQKTGSANLSKDSLRKMKEDAEYYIEEWDEFFTEEEMQTMVEDGYTFELDEAEGETLKKVSGEANREMRPEHEKGDNAPETKQDPWKGHASHDQANDPYDTATKANPKGEAASKSTPGGKVASVSEESDDDLNEDFKARAAVIFEATVNEKVAIVKEELEEQFEVAINEEKEMLNAKVAEYMEEAVQEWLQENALEVKYSLRTEIAENFIRGLKGLFEESYIEIPEEDISVVDDLTEAVEEQKEQIDSLMEELAEAKAFILETKRKDIVASLTEDLTQTQAVRLEKLAENLEADDIHEFKSKVEALKEGYFGPESDQPLIGSLTEEVMTGQTVALQEDDSSISQYAKFLSKTVLK